LDSGLWMFDIVNILRNQVSRLRFAPLEKTTVQLRSVAATRRLKMERQDERGIAFGEAASISSPPSRSQMDGRA